MQDALTPEQKEIALSARRNYYRERKAAHKRYLDLYWYRRGLREMAAANEPEFKTETEAVESGDK